MNTRNSEEFVIRHISSDLEVGKRVSLEDVTGSSKNQIIGQVIAVGEEMDGYVIFVLTHAEFVHRQAAIPTFSGDMEAWKKQTDDSLVESSYTVFGTFNHVVGVGRILVVPRDLTL